MSVRRLFNKYIKNTEYQSEIISSDIFVGTFRTEIQKIIGYDYEPNQIFMGTRSLKHIYDRHIYDKKVPNDFYFLINNLKEIILNPNRIYENHPDKRGDYIFVKIINSKLYMCTLERVGDRTETVSASVTGEKYLSKFTLLWSWGTANSPS